MVKRITPVSPIRPLTNEYGNPSDELRTWVQIITDRALIVGSGSPNGVVQARQGATYLDEDALAGSVFYIKQKSDVGGNVTLGWVLIG